MKNATDPKNRRFPGPITLLVAGLLCAAPFIPAVLGEQAERVSLCEGVCDGDGVTQCSNDADCGGNGPCRLDDSGACDGADVRFQDSLTDAAEADFGFALAFGDVNGDGFDDVAVGAPEDGKVYVFFGSVGAPAGLESGLPSREVIAVNAADVILEGDPLLEFGFSVAISSSLVCDDGATVCDDDADCSGSCNAAPLIVGAPDTDGNGVPRVYAISSLAGLSGARQIDTVAGFTLAGNAGDQLGYAVAVGPLADSATVDYVVSARGAGNGAGEVRLIPASSPAPGNGTRTVVGSRPGEGLGESLVIGDLLAPAGDELAIGAVGLDPEDVCEDGATACNQDGDCAGIGSGTCGHAGRVYVLAAPAADATVQLPTGAYCIEGDAVADFLGFSLAAGDYEGDDGHELAVGAIYADRIDLGPSGRNAGAVYVFEELGTSPLSTCVGGGATAARVLHGRQGWDELGFGLTTANIDGGKDDLVATARWHDRGFDLNTIDEGIAYVIFGGKGFANWPTTMDCPSDSLTDCPTPANPDPACANKPCNVDAVILGGAYSNGSDEIGFAVASGDFNKDGAGDVAVSSISHDRVYLVSLLNSDRPATSPGQDDDGLRNIRDDDDDGDGYLDEQEDCNADGDLDPNETDPLTPNRDIGLTMAINGSSAPAAVSCDPLPLGAGQIAVEITVTNHSPHLAVTDSAPQLRPTLQDRIYEFVAGSLTVERCPAAAPCSGESAISGDFGTVFPRSIVPVGQPALAAGDAAVFRFELRVKSDPGTIFNAESISATVDPVADELSEGHCAAGLARANDDELVVSLQCPDLQISKQDDVDPATVGEPLTYTIDVTNQGTAAAEGVQVTESLPQQLQSASASTSGCDNDPAGVPLCDLGTIAASGTRRIFVTVTVPDDQAQATYLNQATVGADSAELDSTNNSAQETTEIAPAVDLSITLDDGDGLAENLTVIAGRDTIVYDITVTNAGPSTAPNVQVAPSLPAGVTPVATSGCAEDPAGFAGCTLGSLNAGQSTSATLTVSVDPATLGTIVGAASVTSGAGDADPSDNSASEETDVDARVDLAVSKDDGDGSADNLTVAPGTAVSYTIAVQNNGPSDAVNVRITDLLPAGVTPTGSSGCSESPGTGIPVCTLGALAAGASKQATLDVTVDAGTLGSLNNTATALSDTPEENPGDNTAGETTFIADADLSATAVASPDPVAPGGPLTYTITVDNAGPSGAQNVQVLTTLPAGITASSTSGCLNDPGLPVCLLGNLPAGQSATFTIAATVDAGALGSLSADVSASSDTPDTTPGNDDTGGGTLVASADLSIAKSDGQASVIAGAAAVHSYTIVVTNAAGPSTAEDVVVTDSWPTAFVQGTITPPAGSSCNTAGADFSCDLGSLGTGGTRTITVTYTVPADVTPADYSNTASVSALTPDPFSADNASSDLTAVTAACGDGSPQPGEVCDDGNTVDGDGCAADCLSDETCGNGTLDPVAGEICDDGNTVSGDGCAGDCFSDESCGNGILDVAAGEICDDGNNSNGDGCSADCLSQESCGNGVVDAATGETCDDGNLVDGDGCDRNCTFTACGNGILTSGEVCDDGNLLDGDGCSAACDSDETCGNAVVDSINGEICDDGNAVEGDGCDTNCTPTACGNGILTAGEDCDDGNAIEGDGCDSNCTATACGNGVITAGEACDDGNATEGDGCDSNCTVTSCGNGILTSGEVCDDGNLVDGDGCSAACDSDETCGNAVVDSINGEICDDGNVVEGDGCDTNCTPTACGNGILTAGEDCDDGNIIEGDGCDSNCTMTACGNGVVTAGEGCDDGNATEGDGCDTNCTLTACGNGIVTSGEECDDGALNSDGLADACRTDCMDPSCGDGVQDSGESCDDGNPVNDDGCNVQCELPVCGNGILDQGEICEDGNLIDGDGCDTNCTPTTCGNGIVTSGEACDDANAIDGDGCDTNCTVTACGNGVLTAGEECDDGTANSDVAPDACRTDCTNPICGDGVQDMGEACDDGNTSEDDGCNTQCQSPTCGNGIVDQFEVCDDGNAIDGDGCDSNCTPTACGNGIPTAGEACDDGNATEGDGCDTNCTVTACGNGIPTAGEECDDGNGNEGDGCDTNCTLTACGNGIPTAGEECDDGNAIDGDGCDGNCTATTCGNGVTTLGEECDDGNVIDGDGCDNNCTTTACGNGVLTAGEACDDGNLIDGDGCDSNCTVTACGNGVPTAGEECDDGNAADGDGCDNNCTVTACGNGVLTAGEACDDGNLVDGDGCDSNCTPTACGNGVVTSGEECDDGGGNSDVAPDSCRTDCTNPICGDGVPDTGEECDDGNPVEDDGCNTLCQLPVCGNGVVDLGEVCDDGNAIEGDGCDTNCTPTACGNGIPTAGEECDDGNGIEGDGCDTNCTLTTCGNGIMTAGEECDDGNGIEGDGCDTNCTLTTCGNGIMTAGEECDDGNGIEGDGCDTNCTATACGNGISTAGEECDDGNGIEGDGCDTNCTVTACGNGVLTSGEVCDDGNLVDDDGCDSNCTATACGNGVLTSGEVCDDGNAVDGDGCDSNCTTTACGNGVLTAGETCDDGNTTDGDGCSATCDSDETCGNAVIDVITGEVCDDGNAIDGDGCDSNCTPTACGNGILTGTEVCDDGNLVDGDGCDSNCTATACGNGVLTAGETCDDGNTVDGDGCSATCDSDETCGNAVIDSVTGEICDDGNAIDGDGCDSNCTPTACGNGVVAGTEVCDDGNIVDGDGCDSNCTPTACGNGILTGAEVCDDGNTADGDGCSAACDSDETCGNAVIDTVTGEVCDDGNLIDGDGCDANCLPTECGNGVVTGTEICDDGNTVDGDGCDSNCTPTGCGNGILTGTEICDDGNTVDGDGCSAACDSDESCGNAVIDTVTGEICDDGNLIDGDGCDTNCTPTACGNGVQTAGEACDDGNAADGDGCDSNCTPTACGNGILTGAEVCDDGNTADGDGCSAACDSDETCGNAVIDTVTGETCDDGNLIDGDGCDANCQPTECGNGVVTGTEICDDGNTVDGDGCDSNCTPTGCGNGILTGTEICDDGNTVDGDGCSAACDSDETCGNSVTDTVTGEVCDDGNTADGDGCSATCTSDETCGNAVIDTITGEVCDDGNAIDGDGCDSNCTPTACGNGVQTAGEACDDGNGIDGDGCDSNCTATACGNGVQTAGEVCDDGNTADGDGCSATCASDETCGNAVTDPVTGETCDDGNVIDGDGCDSNCTTTACGNGVQTAGEVCDDGNTADGDGCSGTCASDETCGNAVIDAVTGEVCDDGNAIDGDGCDSNCLPTACGNGVLTAGETCDDGNAIDGDGCDSNCTPTACGNGVTTSGETCDDGNLTDDDGCDSNCTLTGCGNGIQTSGEACDDGNTVGGDGCSGNCLSVESGVFLNEVDYDQLLGAQEFVELFAAQGPVDITGWRLTDQETGGNFLIFDFANSDARFPCGEPFVMNAGDRVVVWQGAGTSDCDNTDGIREIFLDTVVFLSGSGDDLLLQDAASACQDYVAFENGSSVDAPPVDCNWTGPNPSNGDTQGTSLSRLDQPPFTDNDSGADWEASGSTITTAPGTPGTANVSTDDADSDGVFDSVDNCPRVGNAGQADADGDGIGDVCEGLVINEVDYDQGVGAQEFIELFAATGLDITGWQLTDQDPGATSLDFVFATSDARFPCSEPFVMNAGDRVVVWQGAGTSDCDNADGLREIFLAEGEFLSASGDDLVLRDQTATCRDYVAFEAGSSVNTPPADCEWTGPNPSNADVRGTSVSRFDIAPLTDTDSGADWEASGATTTTGPISPGDANVSSTDSDGDGVPDPVDNCPNDSNSGQEDCDADMIGDACDTETDGDSDGVCDGVDNCPMAANPGQGDCDADMIGDACDTEMDGDSDGICDGVDNCPMAANPGQGDCDADMIGDACDTETDGDSDGICDGVDNCPMAANAGQEDCDADMIGDACDTETDGDGDGICDGVDPCPNDPDNDIDGDTICGDVDNCPVDANTGQEDCDADMIGDACDTEIDGDSDGICDGVDNCPLAANAGQEDCDADMIGDACDTEIDGDSDGVCDGVDNCPMAANPGQEDCDADMIGDACDTEIDGDSDGICDGVDNCPMDANPDQGDCDADMIGDACDTEIDSDNDGICDGVDACPNDPDNDIDGDTICGDVDNCPVDANPGQEDADMDGTGDACETLDSGVFLNEVEYDQLLGTQEFVELYAAVGPVDITGWRLTDQETGVNSLDFLFANSDARFPCGEPFVMSAGDRVVVWQGTGTSDCDNTDGLRAIFLDIDVFLSGSGDDLLLQDGAAACRDYVAFENGGSVDAPPVDCTWTGPNPSNGGVQGTSLSRFDQSPFADTDSGADWEASGTTTTTGPASPGAANVTGTDSDGDGVPDAFDNCPMDANSGQEDCDDDMIGDACDTEIDGDSDGICDGVDNCPMDANPGQEDCDADMIGDACDTEIDGDSDGICDGVDNCPLAANPGQEDCDADMIGDACDTEIDSDNDGICDGVDTCPNDPDNDIDGDTICGDVDNCPVDANPGQEDADMDGTGDACETLDSGVFINEVDYDQLLGTQEFVELYAAQGPVDITGWRLTDQETSGNFLIFDFANSDARFPCGEPFVMNAGDRVVVWQGAGTSDCDNSDGLREIFLDSVIFLSGSGDDLLLQDGVAACRDYVAFENGSSVNAPPVDCSWTGPNPSNGEVQGISLSRFDQPPFTDTDGAADWEASGTTTTTGPSSPGTVNVDTADADTDGLFDSIDNCPRVSNAGQADADGDGIGDVCEGLVINEVNYDQDVGAQEFIELFAATGLDITGWQLTDQDPGATSLDFVFATSDARFPCSEPFVMNAGDRVVVWQGAGTSDCDNADGLREIFLAEGEFLAASGDDLVLRDQTATCRDYVAFEAGSSVNTPPADCEWTGPNPTNSDLRGTSISRFDNAPLTDTDSGADWEASGTTTTTGPISPGDNNVASPPPPRLRAPEGPKRPSRKGSRFPTLKRD